MAKLLFIPVSITAGLLAGIVGKKIFNGLWGVIDEEEPPTRSTATSRGDA
jgi:hypothetical protein